MASPGTAAGPGAAAAEGEGAKDIAQEDKDKVLRWRWRKKETANTIISRALDQVYVRGAALGCSLLLNLGDHGRMQVCTVPGAGTGVEPHQIAVTADP